MAKYSRINFHGLATNSSEHSNPAVLYTDHSDTSTSPSKSLADTLIDPRHNSTPLSKQLRRKPIPRSSTTPSEDHNSCKSRTLQDRHHEVILRILTDFCLAILPCLFIALAIIAASLNGKQVSQLGHDIEEAARLGPTIYPIIFAAIVARFLRHLARWQAERGQRIGMLEYLIQSQSFAGSIEAVINLRYASLASIAISLLWALSPIGGQSSLRLLTIGDDVTESQQNLTYPRADTMWYFGGSSHYVTTPNVINGLFVSSLLSPNTTRHSAVDSWGNPKIPSPRIVLNQTSDDLSSNPWEVVNPATTSYSSLIGIPIWDVPELGTANFTIEYPVFETDCHWVYPGIDAMEWCELSGPLVSTISPSTNLTCVLNKTTGFVQGPYWDGESFLDSEWSNTSYNIIFNETDAALPKDVDIIYNILDIHMVDNVSYPGSSAKCILNTDHIEAEVFCTNGGCGVSRMRRSVKELQPQYLNPWNTPSLDNNMNTRTDIFSALLELLPVSTGTASESYATGFDIFLHGQDQPFGGDASTRSLYNWTQIPEEIFSTRFSQLFNTFWLASQWNLDITDRSGRNQSEFYNETTHEVSNYYQVANAQVLTTVKVYRANFVWVVLLLVVSIILLLCAVASLLIRLFILAPDILGFVSTLTSDNILFQDQPDTMLSSTLSGQNRAKKLRDLRVKIADVKPDDEVGHIALAPDIWASSQKAEQTRLRRGRLYD